MELYENLQIESLEGEEWVDVIGFDGVYHCSTLGRVKSIGRWVSNGKAQRWVKERIRIQVLTDDGRLTCPLNKDNKVYSFGMAKLIFDSFNPNIENYSDTHYVAHLDKIQTNNKLINLALMLKSDSHSLNYKKNLLPHLAVNNKSRIEYIDSLTERECKICSIVKPIELFKEKNGNKRPILRFLCNDCRREQRIEYYRKSKLK